MKLLVVDDDPFWLRYLRVLLRDTAFQLVEATDGQEARELLKTLDAEVVITDTQMPRVNGVELTRWVRQHRPRTQVILLYSGKKDATDPLFRSVSLCGAHLILSKDEVESPLVTYLLRLGKLPPR